MRTYHKERCVRTEMTIRPNSEVSRTASSTNADRRQIRVVPRGGETRPASVRVPHIPEISIGICLLNRLQRPVYIGDCDAATAGGGGGGGAI